MLRILSVAVFLVYLFTVVPMAAAFRPDPMLRNGPWRAVLERKDGGEIVFNFDLKDSAGKKVLYIRNADERLLVDDITLQGDSVLIRLPFFESQFRAVLTKDGNLEGVWLKRGADNYQSVPFRAVYGEAFRFATGGFAGAGKAAGTGKATGAGAAGTGKAAGRDVSGRWRAVFRTTDGKDTTLRIGEFEQKGQRVTGTFLDAGGDLRYLEGVAASDSLKLSCFDGGHAYLFTARIEGDSRLSGGRFFAGATGYETWAADKDANAKLPDEFTITKWKKEVGPLRFTFRDIDGKTVSLGDERFRGKVVLVQIMGSWCPNCMDETRFLSGFYNEYKSKGVEIVGLAYERSTDFVRSQNSLRSFQQRFQVKYPMLITGVSVGDPERTEKTLPQLERIQNFPTTIFVNRKGEIEKIHTGFSGPGTGVHYAEQQKEFYKTVDGLLAE
jgi:thiol-disulfide isomerase/thioredoxin